MLRRAVTSSAALILLVAAGAWGAAAQAPPATPPPPGLLLTTSGYADGGAIPVKFSCDVTPPDSPPLEWTNTPAGTVSFVLIMHDLDGAPMKGVMDITHWTVFNIPGTATSLPEGIAPGAPVAGDG